VPDDAAVYQLDEERALIVSTDFFTPIVDDGYDYGAIAAANALSDVYAMGGRPLLALNIAALPDDLPLDLIAEIMRGSAETVRQANAVIAGGHTIKDKEPKVGLAVIGEAHPAHVMTKAGAQPGDLLMLTKPLGTGVVTTAWKNDKATEEHLAEAVGWMKRLNRDAAEAGLAADAKAATDITGFGLVGHAVEMARASKVSLRFTFEALPLLEGARLYGEDMGIYPGGSSENRKAFVKETRIEAKLTYEQEMLLFDAQTSGGLLLAIPPGAREAFTAAMTERSAAWWQVGEAAPPEEALIVVK
jgi:selenide,water dikinase